MLLTKSTLTGQAGSGKAVEGMPSYKPFQGPWQQGVGWLDEVRFLKVVGPNLVSSCEGVWFLGKKKRG